MNNKYAETQEASGRLNEGNCENKSKGLGRLRGQSKLNGLESLGVDKTNSSRQDIFGQRTNPRSATGEILKRLSLVEKAFLSYVKGHQERLQERLEKSRKEEEDFLDIIDGLKQEVYELASKSKAEEAEE